MRKAIYSTCFLLAFALSAVAFDLEEQLNFADGLYSRGMYKLAAREYSSILGEYPQNEHIDRICFRRGECYRNLGERVSADSDYRRVFTECKGSPFRHRAGYRRAGLFMDAGQPAAAIELYEAVLAEDPPSDIGAACLYFLAEARQGEGDAKAAAATYRKLRETYEGSAFDGYALLRLGALYADELEEPARALEFYAVAAENPMTERIGAEAFFQIAEILFDEQKYEESAESYGKLISRYPGDSRAAEARLKAGWSAHYATRYAEALKYVDAALADKGNEAGPEWYYLKANCERQLVRYENAVTSYRDVITRFPESDFVAASRYELAMTLYKMGRFEEAVETAAQVDVSGKLERDVYWLLAESHAALKHDNEAIQYYRLIVRKFPEGELAADASYRLAHLLQQRGEYLEAARCFMKTATDYPQGDVAPKALFASGFCHQKLEQHEEAARDWALLAAQYPKHELVEEALYQRAVSELRLKRHKDAGETFRTLLSTYPETRFRADAHYWQGMVFRELGKGADAESELRKALTMEPRRDLRREIDFGLALVLLDDGKSDEAAALLLPLIKSPTQEKFTPPLMEWLAGHLLEKGKSGEAVEVATMLASADVPAKWLQSGWCLAGRGEMSRGDKAAAEAAFRKALDVDAKTPFAAESALYLGDLAAEAGRVGEAKAFHERAAALASSDNQLSVRARAYAGLGRSALASGEMSDASRYFMSVAILFEDPELVPECLAGAVKAFLAQGQTASAREALSELKTRYPDSREAKTLPDIPKSGSEESM